MKLRVFLIVLPLFFTACSGPHEAVLEGQAQGTTWQVKLVTEGGDMKVDEIRQDIEAAFQLIDRQLSNWREDSEISQFNRLKDTEWHPVAGAIVELVQVGKTIHALSDGCYDLTVKPLFSLWGFAQHHLTIPDPSAIKNAMTHIGMDKLDIDVEGHRLRKQDPALEITVDSIAQGYTVAVISRLIESRGFTQYLVEVGGEMRVRGRKGDGSPWRVAIEKPSPMTREVQRVLDLHEEKGIAIMTSGTYRNFFEESGTRYSHIIDPRTGQPVTHHLLSTTVLHDDPTLADAWSTALLCVGEKEAQRISEAEGLQSLIIYEDQHKLIEVMSSRFKALPEVLEDAPSPPAVASEKDTGL
jgi:thiamine biosynthesis lipoprotein